MYKATTSKGLAARGHATNIDIEILNVTNNRIYRMHVARARKYLLLRMNYKLCNTGTLAPSMPYGSSLTILFYSQHRTVIWANIPPLFQE